MLLYLPIILGGILVLYTKLMYEKTLASILTSYTDLRSFRRILREETTIRGTASKLLLINTLITVSAAITYLFFTRFQFRNFDNIYLIFGISAVILFIYFWVRKIIFNAIGTFTEQPGIAHDINAYNSLFYQTLGVVLLPIMFFLNYRLESSTVTWLAFFYNGMLLLLQVIIIVLYFIKLIQELRQTSQLKISGYYLFLYFCTLEILPLIAIILWFIGQN